MIKSERTVTEALNDSKVDLIKKLDDLGFYVLKIGHEEQFTSNWRDENMNCPISLLIQPKYFTQKT